MEKRITLARVPVALECPMQMRGSIEEVLSGEYESGYFGENLTILDIGANAGAFAVWADLRWPQSRIHAYEPNPGTFRLLTRNVAGRSAITCHNVAIANTNKKKEMFWSRFAGDGESGLAAYTNKTFDVLPEDQQFEVPVIHPSELPSCDVLKIDVEGAEADILDGMRVDGVSLILLEYQTVENGDRIKALLKNAFSLEYEDTGDWDSLLLRPGSRYRRELAGNHWGHLFFANRQCNRLHKEISGFSVYEFRSSIERAPSLRQLLSALPLATKNAVRKRLLREAIT